MRAKRDIFLSLLYLYLKVSHSYKQRYHYSVLKLNSSNDYKYNDRLYRAHVIYTFILLNNFIFTLTPGGVRSIVSVYVFVCLSIHSHISKSHVQTSRNFVHTLPAYTVRDSVIL